MNFIRRQFMMPPLFVPIKWELIKHYECQQATSETCDPDAWSRHTSCGGGPVRGCCTLLPDRRRVMQY